MKCSPSLFYSCDVLWGVHVPGFSMSSTLHFPEWGCTAGLDAARGLRISELTIIKLCFNLFRFGPYKGEDYFCRKKKFFVTCLSKVFCFCLLFLSVTPLRVEDPPLQGKGR